MQVAGDPGLLRPLNGSAQVNRKLKAGMVGGGRGAFIGGVHRMAMRLDGEIELVAGALSSNPETARQSGEELGLNPARVYPDYETMAAEERRRPLDERIDFVSVVTPNHMHFPVCRAFLEAGFHVVCDKPLALNLEEALRLREIVRRSGRLFALTYNYTGYPMVKQARALVRSGELGEIRKVVTEYAQGWLSEAIESDGQKQAAWRTDPAQAGAVGCLGDIGSHAENLARYITGLEIDQLCAELTTFVGGRRLDDDASVLLRYKGGAKGVLHASQVSAGEENGLQIEVSGSKASLAWRQERPNELRLTYPDAPWRIHRSGNKGMANSAARFLRLPAGHPEGFIEAFANIYREIVRAIHAMANGEPSPHQCDFPTVDDGVAGMAFLEAAVQSAKAGGAWRSLLTSGERR
jgi:predicted dehydrogenase